MVDSSCVITSFEPKNGTVVNGVKFPVVFTFSERVQLGDGCVAFLNDFGDVTSVCTNGTGIVLSETNATVSIPDKYYYGSAYSVYFENSPFLDMNNVSIPLLKGAYSFTINSPRFREV